MKIAERDLLFPNKKDKKVYKCIDKNDLSSGLCVIDSDCGMADFMKVFPKNKYDSVYKRNTCDLNSLIIEKVINYKVFSFDELLFLKEYENQENLNLNTLLYLSKDFEYSTFIVNKETFLDLVSYVNEIKHSFKYGGVVGTFFRALDHTQEYLYAVSLYDIKAVITNIYSEPFDGICISFELLNKGALKLNKRICPVYSHYVLTNNYEGIFYKDGETVPFEQNFIESYKSFSSYTSIFNDYNKRRENYKLEKANKIPITELKSMIKKHKTADDLFNLDDLNYEEVSEVKLTYKEAPEAKFTHKIVDPSNYYSDVFAEEFVAVPAPILMGDDVPYDLGEIKPAEENIIKDADIKKQKKAEKIEKMVLKYKMNFNDSNATTGRTNTKVNTKVNYFTVGYGSTSVSTYNA